MSTPDTEWEKEKLAEQLHEWYLEATYQEDAKYNIDAVVPYNDLPEGSKILDRYIAGKIIEMLTSRDTYWKEKYKEAFYETFIGAGELWFPHSSVTSDLDEIEGAVDEQWELLLDNLK